MTQQEDLRLRLWQAERRNELETDTTALLDALIERGEEFHQVLGDVIDATRMPFPSDSTPLDRIVTRYGEVESIVDRLVTWVLDEEQQRGAYLNYEPSELYAPDPYDAHRERLDMDEQRAA